MKDYYILLGVVPDAEGVVIKAAYKALIQRYHPDQYKGNATEAQRRTIELNEAYEVLSHPQKRANYDRQYKSAQPRTSDYDENDDSDESSHDESFNDSDEHWLLAVQYYPDLIQLETRLRKISAPLSIGFRQAMLATKEFGNRQQIAQLLEQRFLENYFGTNTKILEFAVKLMLDGKRSGAKELNKTVSVLGEGIEAKRVIDTLNMKYYAEEIALEKERKAKEEQKRKEQLEQERLERREKEKRERVEQERKDRLAQEALEEQLLVGEQMEKERAETQRRARLVAWQKQCGLVSRIAVLFLLGVSIVAILTGLEMASTGRVVFGILALVLTPLAIWLFVSDGAMRISCLLCDQIHEKWLDHR